MGYSAGGDGVISTRPADGPDRWARRRLMRGIERDVRRWVCVHSDYPPQGEKDASYGRKLRSRSSGEKLGGARRR